MSSPKYPRLLTLAAVVVVVAALYFARVILVPFAISSLLAFLLSPFVNRMRKLGLPRVLAVIAVMVFSLGLACGLGWVVAGQLNDIASKIPEYQANLTEKYASVHASFQDRLDKATETVAHITHQGAETRLDDPSRTQQVTISNKAQLLDGVSQIVSFLGAIGVVFLFVVLMLIQKEDFRDRLIRLAGSHLSVTTRAFDEAGAKVSRYLLLTTCMNGLYGLCIGVSLSVLGLPNGILWGALAALLRFIPYVGTWIAAAFPITLALAIFPGWTIPLLAFGLILALDLISAYIVEPWVCGAGTGVSPGALLVAAVFWTWLWGVPGLFLATPLTVCLAVIGKYVPPLGFLAVLLGDGPVLPVEAKVYQRLLAMDQEDASEILLAQLEEKTLVEAYDGTLIPALVLAERDRHKGILDLATSGFVLQAMRELAEEAGDWRRDLTRSEKRAEKEEGEAAAPTEQEPPMPQVQALCVAADDEADHVVALMAAQVLRQIGFGAEVVGLATLTGQLGQIVEDEGIQLVVISDVPPSGFAHVRYICKRLAVKSPDMPIIVGVWGSTLDAQKARERLPGFGSLHFVKSLKETVDCAQQMLHRLRLQSSANRGDQNTPIVRTGETDQVPPSAGKAPAGSATAH